MPGLVKIGYTMDDPWERANQLSISTAVPLPFEVLHAIKTRYPSEVETWVHQSWEHWRVSSQREFFRTTLLHKETLRKLTDDEAKEAFIRSLNHGARLVAACKKVEKARQQSDRVKAICDYEFMQQVESHK